MRRLSGDQAGDMIGSGDSMMVRSFSPSASATTSEYSRPLPCPWVVTYATRVAKTPSMSVSSLKIMSASRCAAWRIVPRLAGMR